MEINLSYLQMRMLYSKKFSTMHIKPSIGNTGSKLHQFLESLGSIQNNYLYLGFFLKHEQIEF